MRFSLVGCISRAVFACTVMGGLNGGYADECCGNGPKAAPTQQLSEIELEELLSDLRDLGIRIGHSDEAGGEARFLGTSATDDDLKRLQPLTDMRVLDLRGTRITDESLRWLSERDWPKLRRLDLSATRITDAGMPFLGKLIQLENLNLDGVSITDSGVSHLKSLSQLKFLSLRRRPVESFSLQITNAGINATPNIPADSRTEVRLTTSALMTLSQLTQLRSLDLTGAELTDESTEELAKLRHLETLDLSETSIGDSSLCHIAKLTSLEWLDLAETLVTASGLKSLSTLRSLESLNLQQTSISDDDLAMLPPLPALKSIWLKGTKVTEVGVQRVKQTHPTLKNVDVDLATSPQGSYTAPDLRPIEAAGGRVRWVSGTRMGNEWIVDFSGTTFGDQDIALLSMFREDRAGALQSLQLEGTKITDAGLAKLAPRDASYINLKSTQINGIGFSTFNDSEHLWFIDLSGTRIHREGLKAVAKLPSLRSLDLSSTAIRDEDLTELGTHSQLNTLKLAKTGITGEGFRQLPTNNSLWEIDLSGSKVTDQSLLSLKIAKELRELSLDETAILGETLGQLATCENLETLSLRRTQLTPAGAQSLARLISLRTVNFDQSNINDDLLPIVAAGLKELHVLSLKETKVTARGLKSLAQMTSLSELNLAGTDLRGHGLADLASLARLGSVDLTGCRMDDLSWRELGRLTGLSELTLDATGLDDSTVVHLQQIRPFYLRLAGAKVTASGLGSLVENRNLSWLDLTGIPLNREIFEVIAKCRELGHLRISEGMADPDGIRWYRAKRPRCEVSVVPAATGK